jgi:hypothetical protein
LLAVDPSPATIPFKFAWSSPLRCEVEHTTRVSSEEGEAPQGSTVHLSLQAVRAGGAWLIRQKVKGTSQDTPTPAATAAKPKARMSDRELEVLLYPPFTVSADGAFRGLELTADDRAILDERAAQQRRREEMIKKLAPTMPAPPSEDALAAATKRAASSWNVLVGAWAGKDIAEGSHTDLSSARDEVVPGFGPIHITDRLTATRAAACRPAPRGGCAKLEMTSESDSGGPSQKVEFRTTSTLVTDPRTLVPRTYTRVMDMRGLKDGMPLSTKVIETMTFRCK